ncbi:hypothetical protein SFHH103_03056 [Sinorhizobium fredii HH103]|uniref:Uncharacterized protein n=2 Tax=Rhizobium fredii TaxID=380 RepID=G9A1G8_SINF1|nr:hypothetical protein SFHH103_03056 [Sinorhizobium fredii HH103]
MGKSMTGQLDLFAWAEQRPKAHVINIVPALCRKVAIETIYKIPPKEGGKVIRLERSAA